MNKRIHKYYVGAKHIAECISIGDNDDWTHETLTQAIEHAKRMMEDEEADCVVVVKIVAVLRRPKTPIVIEKV